MVLLFHKQNSYSFALKCFRLHQRLAASRYTRLGYFRLIRTCGALAPSNVFSLTPIGCWHKSLNFKTKIANIEALCNVHMEQHPTQRSAIFSFFFRITFTRFFNLHHEAELYILISHLIFTPFDSRHWLPKDIFMFIAWKRYRRA